MQSHVVHRARRYAHIVINDLVTDYGVEKYEAVAFVSSEKWAKEIAKRASSAEGVANVADLIADENGLIVYEE